MHVLAQDFYLMCACASGFVYANSVSLGEFHVYWYDELHLKVLVQAIAYVQKGSSLRIFKNLC